MFAAAILDAHPDLWPACQKAINSLGLDNQITVRIDTSGDTNYKGSRFHVDLPPSKIKSSHKHVSWLSIRRNLEGSGLDDTVREIAINIFSILADAEAAVHDISLEDVAFHEVGAADSIIDIVIAAVLIEALSPCQWYVSALPQGRGQVKSQHGYLPLPAPATLRILEGFLLFDDGENGERITPTGAAILKHLNPNQNADGVLRPLLNAGMGFGKNQLKHRANVLRATFYGELAPSRTHDNIDVLRCEIDDQSAEDLAIAIDHLREIEGVLDICQWPVFAKKNRIATALQVLAEPSCTKNIINEILNETQTLGVRQSSQTRKVLLRQETKVGDIRVKLAARPSGVTAKADIDDVAASRTVMARRDLRLNAEARAIKERDKNAD